MFIQLSAGEADTFATVNEIRVRIQFLLTKTKCITLYIYLPAINECREIRSDFQNHLCTTVWLVREVLENIKE